MAVELLALIHHQYFDPTGTIRIVRAPGERYTVDDGGGYTANQLARALVAMGWASPVTPATPAPAKPKPSAKGK